jgi:hypothetical protein
VPLSRVNISDRVHLLKTYIYFCTPHHIAFHSKGCQPGFGKNCYRHATTMNSPKPKAQVRQSVNCRTQVRKPWVRRPTTWTGTYSFTGIENMGCCFISSQMCCWHALVPLQMSGWVPTAKNTLSEYVILTAFPLKWGCTNAPQCYIACLAFNKMCSEYDTPTYLSKAWSKFVHIFSSYWIVPKHVLQPFPTSAFFSLTQSFSVNLGTLSSFL